MKGYQPARHSNVEENPARVQPQKSEYSFVNNF